MINLIILTGVFGSGRTLAMKSFEEDGFFTTDNIPVAIAKTFFETVLSDKKKYPKVAISVANAEAEEFYKIAKSYREFDIQFVGITASDEILRERFRLEKKMHPLQYRGYTLQEAIKSDKDTIRTLTDLFSVFIDTSKLTTIEFKDILYQNCLNKNRKFTVNIFSFGYKRVLPQDIETVFDVRILKNPYWIPELREKNGFDKEVIDYVMADPQTKPLLKKIISYLDYYLEVLKNAERNHASIGIACSGGKHRSVVIANYLAKYYSDKYKVLVNHRDIEDK